MQGVRGGVLICGMKHVLKIVIVVWHKNNVSSGFESMLNLTGIFVLAKYQWKKI